MYLERGTTFPYKMMSVHNTSSAKSTPPALTFSPSTSLSSCSSYKSSRSSDSLAGRAGQTTFAGKYRIQQQIGKGHFAKVYRCIEKSTSKPFAVKCFDRRENMIASRQYACSYSCPYREASILVSLDHQNIVGVQDVLTDGPIAYMVLELAACSLYEWLVAMGGLIEDEGRIIFKQLCDGLNYLVRQKDLSKARLDSHNQQHKQHIIHRDIKPENILLIDQHMTIKICDFGLAQSTFRSSTGLYGTTSYMAPETLTQKERQYTPAVDVWAAGVVLYICLCGFPPFSDQLFSDDFPYKLQQQIALGYFDYPSPFWDDVSRSAMDLVDSMLVVDERRRPTMQDCLQHDWLEDDPNSSPHQQ